MRRKLLFFAIGIGSFYSCQNIKAITDDGKEVVLLTDKTWKFVNESDETALKTLKENSENFTKEKSASFLVRSKKINTGLYINPKKWSFKPMDTGILEYQFTQREGNGYAIFGAEKSSVPNYEIYKKSILTQVSRAADFYKLLDSDVRTVNGKKLLYLRYKANKENLDFIYVGYYMINDSGLSQVVCFSSEKMAEEFLPGFMELLNGFTETDGKVKENVIEEKVIYTSPPPPSKPTK